MIQKEYVRNVTDTNADAATTCVCDSFQPIAGVGIIDDVEHATVLVEKEQRQGTLSTTSSNAAGLGGRRFCFNSRSSYSSSTITTGLLVAVVLVLVLVLQ